MDVFGLVVLRVLLLLSSVIATAVATAVFELSLPAAAIFDCVVV